ncbi:MAG: hypothetical protein HRU20_28880 [Pseudomonadales bacterium]|nr:hypothetical protein [Pseudomonadales bacterium]
MVNVVDTFKADANLILEDYFNDYVDVIASGDAKSQIADAQNLLGYSLSPVVLDYIQDPDKNIPGKTFYERMKFALDYNGTDTVNGPDAFNIDDEAHQAKADILETDLKSYYKESVTSTMTVDQQVMYAGYCAWVFERRGNDLNSAWTNQSGYYDAIPKLVDTFVSFVNGAVYTTKAFFYRNEILSEQVKNVTDYLKTLTSDDELLNSEFVTLESFVSLGVNQIVGTTERYRYKISFDIKSRYLPLKNTIRTITITGTSTKALFLADVKKGIEDIIVSESKKNALIDDLANLDNMSAAIQWGGTVAETVRNFKAINKQADIRKFNRTSDTTGTVPTLEQGAFSYVKAGFTIKTDDDNKGKTTAIIDET